MRRFITFLFVLITYSVIAGENKSGVSPQAISLPSGPGAIEGLGESFQSQMNTGTVSYHFPFKMMPGRAGFQPSLSLSYNGGQGNSEVGMGWSLRHYFVQRQTDKGLPEYNDNDIFIDENGEELIPVGNSTFRAENESQFSRFVKEEAGWTVTLRSGVKMEYGTSDNGQLKHANKIFKWLLQRKVDLNGNEILYRYSTFDSSPQRYLTQIKYNQSDDKSKFFRVSLEYEARPDVLADYRSTFRVETGYRLSSVSFWQTNTLVRRYKLEYYQQEDLFISLLESITQLGDDGVSALPSATFTYTTHTFQNSDAVSIGNGPEVILATEPDATFTDMNGDALPDILLAKPGMHVVFPNNGTNVETGELSFGEPLFNDGSMPNNPGEALGNDGAILVDIDADGLTDFVARQSSTEYSAWLNSGDYTWKEPVVVKDNGGLPFDFEDSAVRLVDINHDKHIDVMYCNKASGDIYSYFINDGGAQYQRVIEKEGIGDAMTFDQRPGMKLVDMNGDRLLDILLANDGTVTYWPSMGNGDWDMTQTGNWSNNELGSGTRMFSAPDPDQDNENLLEVMYDQIDFADFNGDGLSDAWFAPDGADYIRIWLNKDAVSFADSIVLEDLPTIGALSTVSVLDINGNGTSDIVWNSPEGDHGASFYYLELYPEEKPNLLKTASNGIGRTTTFSYSTLVAEFLRDKSKQTWQHNVPVPVNILAEVNVFDGQTDYLKRFSYEGGYFDTTEQEFRGFERATQIEIGDESAPDLVTDVTYDTGAQIEALKGKPLTIAVRNKGEEVFFTEVFHWATLDLCTNGEDENALLDCKNTHSVNFAFQTQREKIVLEKGTGVPVSLRWEYQYDYFGNNTLAIEHGRLDDGWDDERQIQRTFSSDYQANIENWILDKPIHIVHSDENNLKVAEQRNYYDGSSEQGVISAGNLTLQQDWVSDEHYIDTLRNQYDAFGNVIRINDPLYVEDGNGHYRIIDYDTDFHLYPVKETITVDSDISLVFHANYNKGFGVITSSTDFNGQQTRYDYDSFSRLVGITKPLDSKSTVEYDYVLAHQLENGKTINWIETRQRESFSGSTLDSRKFFDGLSRHIMTRAEGETPGQVVVSHTVQFNQRKTPHRKYLPYFENVDISRQHLLDYIEPGFDQPFTEHRYDALGRETDMLQPDGSVSQISYEPLVRIVKDEEQSNNSGAHAQGAMRYEEDGLQDEDGNGRLRKVTEIFSNDEHWLTQYQYDLLDNLIGYTDSQGNRKQMTFDGISRKTFMNDPDRGVMYYEYDDTGNLISTLDAKNQSILMTYDGANRLLTETYGADKETADVRYHYDKSISVSDLGIYWLGSDALSPARLSAALLEEENKSEYDINSDGHFDVADVVAANFLQSQSNHQNTSNVTLTSQNTMGQLVKVEDNAGEIVFSYDARGRNLWSLRSILDRNESLHHFYSAMDYDSMDRVTEMTYPDGSFVQYKYNGRGLLESIPNVISEMNYNPAGQNLTLQRNNKVTTSYQYDGRLRLSRLQSKSNDQLTLQDLNYTYDAVSNITAIIDARSSEELISIGRQIGISEEEALLFNASQSFVYDNLYRLRQAGNENVSGEIHYQYDRIGNMVSKEAELTTSDALMNLGRISHGGNAGSWHRNGRASSDPPGPHALTSWGDGEAQHYIEYDANGNTVLERGQRYQWDFKDRLIVMTKSNTSAIYLYDYQDTRKYKYVQADGGNDEVFYIDKYSEVRNGQLLKYAYAGSQRIARSQLNNNHQFTPQIFYLHDHLGSTNFATDETGKVQEQIVHYPFGRVRKSYRNSDLSISDYRFTGKEKDVESDLLYFEARYLNFSGVFTSPDPLGLTEKWLYTPQQLNIYTYSKNNPLVFIDLDGKDAIYVAFPDYEITVKNNWIPQNVKNKLGIPNQSKIPRLGHAGVILIDKPSGFTKYYQYGRYDSEDLGEVESIQIPNLKYGKDGTPTKASLNRLLSSVSQNIAKGTRVEGAFYKNDKFKKMNDFATSRINQNHNPNRKPYCLVSYNCGTFAKETIEAGGVDMPIMLDPRPNSYIHEAQKASDFNVKYPDD